MYNLNQPMKWKEFKKMPHDLRAEYISKLSDLGATRFDIADMLGISVGYYSDFMTKEHKGERLISTHNKKGSEAFVRWYCNSLDAKAEPENEPEPKPAEPETKTKAINTVKLELDCGSLSYTGDPRAIFEKVLLVLDTTKSYEINVNFVAAKEEAN